MLDWRLDSDSDWKIIVSSTSEGTASSTEYKAHRRVLNGQNECNIVDRFEHGNQGFSKVDLPTSAAEQFPVLLDFVYRGSGELRMSQQNAIILKHLAEYFACEPMLQAVNLFCQKQLHSYSSGILALFYQQASDLELSTTTALIEKLCCDNFNKLFRQASRNVDLVAALPPSAWCRVFAGLFIDGEGTSKRASLLVQAICTEHKAVLDRDVFNELTAKLTAIHYYASHGLMMHEFSYSRVLSSLQTKCVDAIVSSIVEETYRTACSRSYGGEYTMSEVERLPFRCPLIEKLYHDESHG